jgi:Zn-dependent protease
MGWSFSIAKVAGISIKVHVTFFLILILGAVQWGQYGVAGAIFGVLLMILLFVCVTLHELGHSLVAQRLGIPVREIILLPLGGVALLSRNPEKAWHELLIAIAGPLVNLVIAAGLFAATGAATALGSFDGQALQQEAPPSFSSLLVWLLQANILLVVFNLIPAFPLDGGRIFRALLAMVLAPRIATRIAVAVGQFIAILLGVFGVSTGNFSLVLVAVFIFFGAGQENAEGQARTMLITKRVGDAYNRYALTLDIGDHVSKVVDYILTSYQPDFAVVQGGKLLGIVTRDDVFQALASDPRDLFVTGVMRREFLRVPQDMMLDQVRQQMTEHKARVAAVYDGETYLGLVSVEDIGEALAVLAFQQRQEQLRKQAPDATS